MQSTPYSCLILWNLNFINTFLKNTQISNFIKIDPMGACCSLWTDGHDKTNRRFSQFYDRLILTVATHHKMSTSVNPLPASSLRQLTLVGRYKIWCSRINYFYGLVIVIASYCFYYYYFFFFYFMFMFMFMFMQKSNHYTKFVGTMTIHLNTEVPLSPKIFCVFIWVYIIRWTLSNTSVVVKIL